MRFPAFFDTNVLYGALLNDLVLHLADAGLYRPLWSSDVLAELRRNLVNKGESEALVEKRVGTMATYFPDAMVLGYADLIPAMTNDPKDRHVLAAAIRGRAEVLVTFNIRDFPESSLDGYDLEIVHPDAFLLDQLDLHPRPTREVVEHLVAAYARPEVTLHDYLLTLTRAGVPEFATELRRLLL